MWALVAYFLAQVAAGIVGAVGVLIYLLSHGRPGSEVAPFVMGTALFPIALASVFASGFVTYRIVRRSFPGPLASGALRPVGWLQAPRQAILASALAGFLLALLYLRVAIPLWPPAPHQQLGPVSTAAAAASGWSRHFWAFLAAVAAPPVEEFLFRGALLAGLKRSFGALPAGALVTIVFVLCHLPETHLYYPAIAAIAVLALGCVVARVRTGSLLPPIALHCAYNLALVVITYARAVGTLP